MVRSRTMNTDRTLHLVQLEPIETRYTKQWFTHLPDLFVEEGFNVWTYRGEQLDSRASEGAFLNWSSTNYYKSSQAMEIAESFHNGFVKANDVFLFTDFWNPVVIQVRYMSVMMGIPVKIVGLAHAGSYDQYDWLGRNTKGDDHWVKTAEGAMTSSYDAVVFATNFHRDIFRVIAEDYMGTTREVVAGFPMEYIKKIAKPVEKENIVLFTQRNAPEKQPELFDKLAYDLRNTGWEFINVQKQGATKDEYHNLLNRAKMVVSFANQETLGITPYEALVCGCDILVPNRLSYVEMYLPCFRYTDMVDFASLVEHRVKEHDSMRGLIEADAKRVGDQFFSSGKLVKMLKAI